MRRSTLFQRQIPIASKYSNRRSLPDPGIRRGVHKSDSAGDWYRTRTQPLVLAKTVATVDRLSGGRFILGAGVGWLAEEFQALGISFDRRAQRTREYIDVMAIEAFY
jgi:hypothetical protein